MLPGLAPLGASLVGQAGSNSGCCWVEPPYPTHWGHTGWRWLTLGTFHHLDIQSSHHFTPEAGFPCAGGTQPGREASLALTYSLPVKQAFMLVI